MFPGCEFILTLPWGRVRTETRRYLITRRKRDAWRWRHGHHRQKHWHPCTQKGAPEEDEEEVPPSWPALSGALLRLWPMHHAGWTQHHPGGSIRLQHTGAFCQSPDHHWTYPAAGGLLLFRGLLRLQPPSSSPQLAEVEGGRQGHGADGTRRSGGWGGIRNRDQWAYAAGYHSCAAEPHVLPWIVPGVQPREGSSRCGSAGALQALHHDGEQRPFFCFCHRSLLSLHGSRRGGEAQPATWRGGHLAAHKLSQGRSAGSVNILLGLGLAECDCVL